jgi:hypothetical protein
MLPVVRQQFLTMNFALSVTGMAESVTQKISNYYKSDITEILIYQI